MELDPNILTALLEALEAGRSKVLAQIAAVRGALGPSPLLKDINEGCLSKGAYIPEP